MGQAIKQNVNYSWYLGGAAKAVPLWQGSSQFGTGRTEAGTVDTSPLHMLSVVSFLVLCKDQWLLSILTVSIHASPCRQVIRGRCAGTVQIIGCSPNAVYAAFVAAAGQVSRERNISSAIIHRLPKIFTVFITHGPEIVLYLKHIRNDVRPNAQKAPTKIFSSGTFWIDLRPSLKCI